MAKKRTQIPFYGKIEQRLEQLTGKLSDGGKFKEANELRTEITKRLRKRKPSNRLAPWIGPAILPDGSNGRWEKGHAVPR